MEQLLKEAAAEVQATEAGWGYGFRFEFFQKLRGFGLLLWAFARLEWVRPRRPRRPRASWASRPPRPPRRSSRPGTWQGQAPVKSKKKATSHNQAESFPSTLQPSLLLFWEAVQRASQDLQDAKNLLERRRGETHLAMPRSFTCNLEKVRARAVHEEGGHGSRRGSPARQKRSPGPEKDEKAFVKKPSNFFFFFEFCLFGLVESFSLRWRS